MDDSGCLRTPDIVTPVARRHPGAWLHFGVAPARGRRMDLYAELLGTARELLADGRAEEFFFLHKQPGVRMRFQAGASRAHVDALLRQRLSYWHQEGLVADWNAGVYEPEEFLFGGPVSMRSVHRVFTADSLAWLGFHSAGIHGAPEDRPAGREGAGARPAWAMSLLMVRALLDALEIVGWEDLDVWDRLRRQTGRRFAALGHGAGTAGLPAEAARIEAALRAGWTDPDSLTARLPDSAVKQAEEFRTAVAEAGEQWLRTYFTAGNALIGPREAAAFVIVFHWNRAGLSILRQTLIAEALTARPGGEQR
ncbi:thiopeptide-type bacteriocin biosynthesis protein [Streptomyces sp. NPDC041068]|uniref:thiopeptide-type bacteriocin biosynthesis protein n=1 Tax=Streptomyces sp. NPDC041068 TaxID=3155130 RepID=UPI0033C5D133